jgi:lambda family phage portal protein
MPKPQPPAPSLLERAIGYISPAWAFERHKSRTMTAMSGGYVGAGYSERFAAWSPGVRDADGDSLRDLRSLRARSRDLVRNSPIAAGFVDTKVSHVVGSGLSLQSRIDAQALGLTQEQAEAWQRNTERRFGVWAASVYSDAAGEQDFYEQQDLALRTQIESGDAFAALPHKPREGWPFRLVVQLIEADRICNPNGAGDTDRIAGGLERDEYGEPLAAFVCSHHPGSMVSLSGVKWTRVPLRGERSGRRNLLQLKRKLRPGQARGIPELAPIIATVKQMERYATAEVDAAVNAAAQAVFAKMDPEAFEDIFNADAQKAIVDKASQWDGGIQSGRVINLLPGEDIVAPELGRPNPNFDPFFSAFMRFVGMGVNIPVEVLTKHFQSSYSAARAALMDAWRNFKARRLWLASKFCQPVYEEWLADEVAEGRIAAPGFFADALVRAAWCSASWSGDGPGALDPVKEANAAQLRMEMGLSTLADETLAYSGGDWQANHAQRVREVTARVSGGLQAPPGAPPRARSAPPAEDPPDA